MTLDLPECSCETLDNFTCTICKKPNYLAARSFLEGFEHEGSKIGYLLFNGVETPLEESKDEEVFKAAQFLLRQVEADKGKNTGLH